MNWVRASQFEKARCTFPCPEGQTESVTDHIFLPNGLGSFNRNNMYNKQQCVKKESLKMLRVKMHGI